MCENEVKVEGKITRRENDDLEFEDYRMTRDYYNIDNNSGYDVYEFYEIDDKFYYYMLQKRVDKYGFLT